MMLTLYYEQYAVVSELCVQLCPFGWKKPLLMKVRETCGQLYTAINEFCDSVTV